jgi:hypothetical protein
VDRADELAAHLYRPAAVRRIDLLDTPAHPVARLQHDDVGASRDEVTRGCKTGKAGAQDEDVAQAVAASSSASTRSASGGR